MSTETLERPRTSGPGDDTHGNWQVIVLNDDHNTFDHVAKTLARVIPGVNLDAGHRFADQIHNSGPGDRLDRSPRARRALLGAAQVGRADDGAARAALSTPRPRPFRIAASAGGMERDLRV